MTRDMHMADTTSSLGLEDADTSTYTAIAWRVGNTLAHLTLWRTRLTELGPTYRRAGYTASKFACISGPRGELMVIKGRKDVSSARGTCHQLNGRRRQDQKNETHSAAVINDTEERRFKNPSVYVDKARQSICGFIGCRQDQHCPWKLAIGRAAENVRHAVRRRRQVKTGASKTLTEAASADSNSFVKVRAPGGRAARMVRVRVDGKVLLGADHEEDDLVGFSRGSVDGRVQRQRHDMAQAAARHPACVRHRSRVARRRRRQPRSIACELP